MGLETFVFLFENSVYVILLLMLGAAGYSAITGLLE